jgi:hypothetical protein
MEKTITNFNIDFSIIPPGINTRVFSITGEDGAVFSLEVKDNTGKYYNFITNTFQTNKSGLLNKTISSGVYDGIIRFPAVPDSYVDQYDVFLSAEPLTTKHADYNEVRFGDGSIDVNRSTGSNSLLMTKVLYQYPSLSLTLTPFSAQSTIEVGSLVTDTVTSSAGSLVGKQAFSISCSVTTASKCYRIIKQPTELDAAGFLGLSIGSAPIKIPGENEYPAVTGTDATDGVVSGPFVTMAEPVADTMAVGDKVTGTGDDFPSNVTVVSLDSANVFTASQSLTIDTGITLSFSNQMNYRWLITNQAHLIKPGMKIITNSTNLTANTTVADYLDTTTLWAGTEEEEELVNVSLPAIDTLGLKPTITNGLITTQAGSVIFDKQQKLALAGDALRIGGYGTEEILRIQGWEVVFSDLKVELTPVTTKTTGAVSNSTSVPVEERGGILDDVSTVSGIGIDASVAAPTVDTGAGAVTGPGTLVLTAAQTLESGITLAFTGAGTTATITGNIEILKAGSSSAELNFDVEKLLSIT